MPALHSSRGLFHETITRPWRPGFQFHWGPVCHLEGPKPFYQPNLPEEAVARTKGGGGGGRENRAAQQEGRGHIPPYQTNEGGKGRLSYNVGGGSVQGWFLKELFLIT